MSSPAYFISDVHLTLDDSAWERNRRRRLFSFFRMIRETGGELYILGDFFDFWFEYNRVIPKGYFAVLHELKRLTETNITVHFVPGNHDYWTMDFLDGELGLVVHPGDTEILLQGHRILLTHGDGLIKNDSGYRALRRFIRNSVTVKLFRWLHPDFGVWIAQSASTASRKQHPPDINAEAKFTEMLAYSKDRWAEGVDCVIMGHYHLNRLQIEPEQGIFLCLGDWISQYTFGKLSDGKLTLEQWSET